MYHLHPTGYLQYTTPRLTRDTEILGSGNADLWLSSTASDTDLLDDERRVICTGARRMRGVPASVIGDATGDHRRIADSTRRCDCGSSRSERSNVKPGPDSLGSVVGFLGPSERWPVADAR